MKEKLNCLKKILLENQDKRILVLSASEVSIQKIYHCMSMGCLYESVLMDLLEKEFGGIEKWYVQDTERERVGKQIQIEKGIPLFSTKIIDCDFILFLKIEPKVLKIVCDYERTEYIYILKKQQELSLEMKEKSYPVKIVSVYPKESELEKMPRNVYVYGKPFSYLEDKRGMEAFEYDSHFHFPYIKQVDTLEDLKRKQGFLLIIDEEKLPEKEIVDIDKTYRSLFNHFQFVYITTNDEKKMNFYHLKYSNLYYMNREYIDNDSLLELYYEFLLNNKRIKFSKKKKECLEKMHQYLKKKNVVTTNELANTFSLSYRNVERYMNDYNQLYKTIGYDFKENAWYIIH